MHLYLTAILLSTPFVISTALLPRSTIDGPCTGPSGAIGVCVPTASCTQDNGTYIDNGCPGTPEDIKCCTKPKCELEARSGDCRWAEQCGGGKSLIRNLCPGPDAFRCCITDEVTAPMSTSNLSVVKPTVSSKKPSPTSKATPKPTSKPKPNLGEKILAKAKEAKGLPCKLTHISVVKKP
jgi:hypothetical protein